MKHNPLFSDSEPELCILFALSPADTLGPMSRNPNPGPTHGRFLLSALPVEMPKSQIDKPEGCRNLPAGCRPASSLCEWGARASSIHMLSHPNSFGNCIE